MTKTFEELVERRKELDERIKQLKKQPLSLSTVHSLAMARFSSVYNLITIVSSSLEAVYKRVEKNETRQDERMDDLEQRVATLERNIAP